MGAVHFIFINWTFFFFSIADITHIKQNHFTGSEEGTPVTVIMYP
jgi:hypothetical protein